MSHSLPIIDGHVTVGELTQFGLHSRPDDLLTQMDGLGIAMALLGPADRWLAVDNQAGNEAIAGWIRTWPDRFRGYAAANPWYGPRAVAELERALDSGLSALKLHPARQGFSLLDGLVNPLLEVAARRGVPVYVVTGSAVSAEPLQLAELARQHPTVPFIMGVSGGGDFKLRDFVPSLGQAANLYAETVGNAPDSLTRIVQRVGEGRVVFVSDSPFGAMDLELGKLERLPVSAAARAAILGGNMARLLGLQGKGE
ncbi:MAG: amidohydrolase family protein [Chloroflexi bacterium]|nr:amidohydrolase family protein [Chloroflexota bacterium]